MNIYSYRIRHVREELSQSEVDAILVSNAISVEYLTGFDGSYGSLLIGRKGVVLFTDARYYQRAVTDLKRIRVRLVKNDFCKVLKPVLVSYKIKRLGFEADTVNYQTWNEWKKKLINVTLVPLRQIVESVRIIKSRDEVVAIQSAVGMADQLMASVKRYCYSGITEIGLVEKINNKIRRVYKAEPSFPSIVAYGKNTAVPHAKAGKTKLVNNRLILIDLGIKKNGYSSDLTRTFWLGRITRKFECIYNIVLRAQEKAIESIAPGISIGKIDKIARDFVKKSGYGRYFTHSLGHGIGKEVHESPRVYYTNKKELRAGMVFSVEPGVYLPGWGGVRIEDLVLVTDKGCRVLSKSPKQLTEIVI